MKGPVFLLILSLVALSAPGAKPAAPTRDQVRASLLRATAYLRSIATHGGFLWRYSPDLAERAGENVATPTQIWIQPPGTPSIGMAFLDAYEASKDKAHMGAARAAAQALADGQLESGGWDYMVDFGTNSPPAAYRRNHGGKLSPPLSAKLKNTSTFDDNTTQSAIRFLLRYADVVKPRHDPQDEPARQALSYALEKMLEAQYPNGAWPQRYDGKPRRVQDFPIIKASIPEDYPRAWTNANYYRHYTLNDHTHRDCVSTMLDAYHRTGDQRFLASARKAGDFLELAQLPEPQPAWAQQYDSRMQPAWARAFEPPCVSAAESVGAAHTLMDLYVETGDERYLRPFPSLIAWYERSQIASNRWARYYELRTNRHIFGDRDGQIHYRLQDISAERQTGYSWSGEYGVRGMIGRYHRLKERGGTNSKTPPPVARPLNRSTVEPDAKRAAGLVPRVQEILATQDAQGRWISRSTPKRDWKSPESVEMGVFAKNMGILSEYLRATE